MAGDGHTEDQNSAGGLLGGIFDDLMRCLVLEFLVVWFLVGFLGDVQDRGVISHPPQWSPSGCGPSGHPSLAASPQTLWFLVRAATRFEPAASCSPRVPGFGRISIFRAAGTSALSCPIRNQVPPSYKQKQHKHNSPHDSDEFFLIHFARYSAAHSARLPASLPFAVCTHPPTFGSPHFPPERC